MSTIRDTRGLKKSIAKNKKKEEKKKKKYPERQKPLDLLGKTSSTMVDDTMGVADSRDGVEPYWIIKYHGKGRPSERTDSLPRRTREEQPTADGFS